MEVVNKDKQNILESHPLGLFSGFMVLPVIWLSVPRER